MLKLLLVAVVTVTTLCEVKAVTSDPGCSFSNGQCAYTVQLGHTQHCDRVTRDTDSNILAHAGTGFQSCSCRDLDGLTQDVTSLTTGMTTLQQNFDTLAKALNVTQAQLNQKTLEYLKLQGHNVNLTALLADKDNLLSQSKVDLVGIVGRMSTDLDHLRNQLTDQTNNLAVCKTTLNIIDNNTATNPVLYGGFHTDYCAFEDTHNSLCGYTTSASTHDPELWVQGTGRRNTASGPVADHTFGTPKGHYMYVDPYRIPSYGTSGHLRKARLESPEFHPAGSYCVRFWYTLYGVDIGTFSVYAKVGSGDGYSVWSRHGQQDKYWHMAQVSLDSEYTSFPFRIIFEGTTSSYRRNEYVHGSTHIVTHNGLGYIAIDDVYVYNTSCSCPNIRVYNSVSSSRILHSGCSQPTVNMVSFTPGFICAIFLGGSLIGTALPTCPAGARKMTAGNQTSCYTFHISPLSWYDAVKQCKTESPNGHLVSIDNKAKQDFIVDVIQNDAALTTAGNFGFYTSGNDEKTEGHFVWTNTGYPYAVNYTNWQAGQPNNVGNVQQCLLLQYPQNGYKWGDVNCNDRHPYICEIRM